MLTHHRAVTKHFGYVGVQFLGNLPAIWTIVKMLQFALMHDIV